MRYLYLVTPFATWLLCGVIKFAVNSVRARRWAFDQIGYGGMPSNHSAIVASTATAVALREGIDSPAFGAALTLAFIVTMDAKSLRRQVGAQAVRINRLIKSAPPSGAATAAPETPLRERIGHTRGEILAGLAVGAASAWAIQAVLLRLAA